MEYKRHTADTLKYLYKYRSLASTSMKYVEPILTQHKLYFVNPLMLNDPFECKPKYIINASRSELENYLDQMIKDRKPELNRSDRRQEVKNLLKNYSRLESEKVLDDSRYRTLERVGICSFSEIYNDILMWSHYADSHRGICLRFKASSDTPFFAEALSVTYQNNYPIVDMIHDDDDQKLKKLILTKSKHWEYESEWRMINYTKGYGEHAFPAKSLDGIILGARISDSDRNQVLSWLNQYDHDIDIFQAKLLRTEYGIDLIQLT